MAIDDELIEQANKLIKKNDKNAALALLQRAIKINPKNELAWSLMADASEDPATKLKYLKRADNIKKENAAIQEEIQKLRPEQSKPHLIWNKTTRIRAVLIFLVFTLIPALWWVFYDVIPTLSSDHRMTGEWNVAVVGFTDMDSGLTNANITLISKVFSNRFAQEMEELGNDARLVVQVWNPEQVKRISGDTAEKRAAEAEQIANDINADMVIYGYIQHVDDSYLLQPEFYIRAENYYESEELIGQHRFGGPISIIATHDTLPSQLQLNIELARRSKILALVTRGLSLYLISSYDQASQFFTQANQDEYWPNDDGRETIYLFQGNAAIRMQQLEQAKLAYDQAIQIEPEYGRGYIGLANVRYLQSTEAASELSFSPDRQHLDQAEKYYQYALQIAASQPASAEIPSKAAFGLGQVSLTKWFLSEDTHDQTLAYFMQVLTDYDEGKKPQLKEMASESHARLALIYRQDGQADSALAEFQKALELSTLPERKGLYYASVGDLYRQQGNIDQANHASDQSIEQYRIALGLPVPSNIKAHYWVKIAEQHLLLQQKSQAIDAYQQALKLLPENSSEYNTYQQRLESMPP